jgi:sulfur carrier protein
MFITVSGEKKEVKDGLSLEELIEQENVQTPQYVTVSLNDEFIETQDRDKIVLKDGDTVEFLYFMGGGAWL